MNTRVSDMGSSVAARHSLTVCRVSHGCMQVVEFHDLTKRQVEDEKQLQREMYPTHDISFEVES